MESRTDYARIEIGEPDIGFQAGFGFYLGLVAAGFAAIAGILADLTTAALLGLLPTFVTAVTIVGHVLAKRAHGLPEEIGRSRRLRLACYLPPVAAVATFYAAYAGLIEAGGRFALVTALTVLLTGIAAFGVDRMSRNRYVDMVTADEPAATWTYWRTSSGFSQPVFTVIMAITTLFGAGTALTGHPQGLFWSAYGLLMLYLHHSDRYADEFGSGDRWTAPKLRAHEAGLVVGRPFAKTLVPWDDVEDVRLTDDALVVERRRFGRRSRWFDLRCDREAIDDPEAVAEAIEAVRSPLAAHSR
ncbi:PH domain-containing protein [Halosolutus gelatinilyticus]|uniref:PH domain-containing protein n=1 Tax=Halosolutus gelatinilyticus TaxID=2931975 RepID=UPI001FF3AA5A|nr:PH domain-containing protein [Halosolutus gelatinilyticus]